MKIFYTCYNDLSMQAGDARHIMEIAENLKGLGHEVLVFAPKKAHYRQKSPIKIVYVPLINVRILNILSYNLVLFFYLFFYSFRKRPDAIYSRQMGWCLTPLLISKLMRLPLVMEIQVVESGDKGTKKEMALGFITRLHLKLCDRVITTNKFSKQRIQAIFGIPSEKINVVPCGANIDLFRPIPIPEARKRLSLDQEGYFVGSVSTLYPWHGEEYLLKAAPFILKELPKTKFIIVGEGVNKEELIALAQKLGIYEKVIFTGEVLYEKVPQFINALDLGVSFFKPVRKDGGNPIKLYEYFSCARPVIASDVKGYGDFVEGVGAGISVDATDPERLAKEIIYLLKNRQLRRQMGEKGRKAVVEGYSWEKAAKKVERVCEEVLASKR